VRDFPDIFDQRAYALAQRDLKPDGWRLESPVSLRLLDRLRQAGQPLGEYVQGRFYYGIKTGLNKAFVVDRTTRDRLIAEHPSSAEVLKPFLRGRDVKRWRYEYQDLWLVFVPWHFPLHENPAIIGVSTKAELEFAKRYPAIYEHLRQYKPQLEARNRAETGVRYEWYALQRWGAEYWREFEQPKVITGRFMNSPTFAFDDLGTLHGNANSFIAGASPFLTGLLNSNVAWWVLCQICTDLQNGYLQAHNENLAELPIPAPRLVEHRLLCDNLAQALIWLHGPATIRKARDVPVTSMCAYFEQWLNGLVYELFFPDELHGRKLMLFAETARLNPPDLSTIPEPQKLACLHQIFEQAYDSQATLRSMLFSLHSLEVVRIIEEPLERSTTTAQDREP
jgi:adenine-specific DNA-methyltransferase